MNTYGNEKFDSKANLGEWMCSYAFSQNKLCMVYKFYYVLFFKMTFWFNYLSFSVN